MCARRLHPVLLLLTCLRHGGRPSMAPQALAPSWTAHLHGPLEIATSRETLGWHQAGAICQRHGHCRLKNLVACMGVSTAHPSWQEPMYWSWLHMTCKCLVLPLPFPRQLVVWLMPSIPQIVQPATSLSHLRCRQWEMQQRAHMIHLQQHRGKPKLRVLKAPLGLRGIILYRLCWGPSAWIHWKW